MLPKLLELENWVTSTWWKLCLQGGLSISEGKNVEGMFSEGAEGLGSCGYRIRKGTEEKLGREEKREKLGNSKKSTGQRKRSLHFGQSAKQ